MSEGCPICGGSLEGVIPTLVPDRGIVVGGGSFACLTGVEMRLLQSLTSAYPHPATKERLMNDIYFGRVDDEPEIKIIDVIVCKVRAKISGLGFEIETHWGNGYSLGVRPKIVTSEADE